MSVCTGTTALRYAYLHGLASSPLCTQAVQLQRWFQNELNISLDLPDLTIPSFSEQCLSNMVDHVEKIITQSNSVWVLIGNSFGGLVATLIAQRQPNSIHSLLLLAPAFNPIECATPYINIDEWKNNGFIHQFNPSTQRDEPVHYKFVLDLHSYPPYPIVTTCPITIIHGLHDIIMPIEISREYIQKVQLLNKYPTLLIEVDDDHNLRKEETLNTIKKIILDHRKYNEKYPLFLSKL